MTPRFWTTEQMVAAGWKRNALAAAVRGGELLRPRVGRYCLPDAPADLVRCVRLGGVATASTAARSLGIWAPEDRRLRVAVPLNSPRLRDPDSGEPWRRRNDVALHWERAIPTSASLTGVAEVGLAIGHAFDVHPPEFALAMLDSALRLRFLRADRLADVAARVAVGLRPVVLSADGRAGSGTESIIRDRLRRIGLRVEIQVGIRGVGSVDLVVEGRLIVEADGREFHLGAQFAEDRRRDLASTTLRYRTIRVTYDQVMNHWPAVEAAVLSALAA